jgi:triacylglycerol esterase/lipase EstA (alpha/beta hydrolase family)
VVAVVVALAAVMAPSAVAQSHGGDPPFSVGAQTLAAALQCSSPDLRAHPDHEPVLLVHGTFTKGEEQFAWNWSLMLQQHGYDYCTITYPDRGMGDQQISAEYVAYAVMRMHQLSRRKVGMVGHSQGASMPRWAIKYWRSVRADLDDFVLIAGPNHGTTAAGSPNPVTGATGGMPPAFYQFSPSSNFVRHVNSGDETPGNIDYTTLYSYTDELVQPASPVPTAALDYGITNPHVTNINVQDACPGRVVDHLSIGTTDEFVMAVALDAFEHPGPANPARVGTAACSIPSQYITPATAGGLQQACCGPTVSDFTDAPRTTTEPPIASYAVAQDGQP